MDSTPISPCKTHISNCPLADFPNGFPCGVMHCTCEKYPRIIYANQWIFDLMGLEQEGEYWTEYLKDNLYFMLPNRQWPSLRKCLQKARNTGEVVPVEHRIKNHRDEEIPVMGWVRTIRNADGEEQFLFMYICMPREQQERHVMRENAYLHLLSGAYDGVFKVDRQNRIVECLSINGKLNSHTYFVQGMRVVLDCLLQKSYYMLVYEGDRSSVESFFGRVTSETGFSKNGQISIEFRTIGDGILKEFVLTATELDDETVLLCCREVTEEKSAKRRKEERSQLRSIEARMGKNSEKSPVEVTAYRLLQGRVFAQSQESSYLSDRGASLAEFLSKEGITEEEYNLAKVQGETELQSIDSPEKRKLYITSRNVGEGSEEEHLMLIYRQNEQKVIPEENTARVTIHTFGFFDVLVDGKPIVFPHEKSKEMLALMVDRKGSFVGNPYFISCLWEDEPYGEKIQSRCRQTAFRLMETLKKYGIEDIIEKVDGHRRIVPEKVKCDYFDYISGDNSSKKLFNGTYMSDYSWGEETLSTLLRNAEMLQKQTV